ncbi:SDR family oxidoreductase [Rhodovarius lipocyclicus]|uniref:SDR family oxidoreductase n=1 Tax=Rhodovarius lipocyclicus TaxID=268410 RepID=UPI001359A3A8|nr:sugar nucleotide-binding protein [Rhodovarius lipocyclicus]
MTEILLTGATGMLGSSFAEALGPRATLVPRTALDIRDPAAVMRMVATSGASVLINCAADVDAEAAEDNPDRALAANSMLPGLLAIACRRAGMRLVHFSSTGCYGAWKTTPYSEEDPVRPTTVHHSSKVSGEAAVREAAPEHVILRTGWLFGGGPGHKKNFVWKRLLEAAAEDELGSDTAQFGNPTYVGDVVAQTMALIEAGLCGTYNCVSQDGTSRFAYVERIVRAGGLDCRLVPRGAFARRAPVSPNEMAVNQRLGLLGLDMMPAWDSSIDAYVAALRASTAWVEIETIQRKCKAQ